MKEEKELKMQITLGQDNYGWLVTCLERYLEKLTQADEIRSVAKLVEKIEDEAKEVLV